MHNDRQVVKHASKLTNELCITHAVNKRQMASKLTVQHEISVTSRKLAKKGTYLTK